MSSWDMKNKKMVFLGVLSLLLAASLLFVFLYFIVLPTESKAQTECTIEFNTCGFSEKTIVTARKLNQVIKIGWDKGYASYITKKGKGEGIAGDGKFNGNNQFNGKGDEVQYYVCTSGGFELVQEDWELYRYEWRQAAGYGELVAALYGSKEKCIYRYADASNLEIGVRPNVDSPIEATWTPKTRGGRAVDMQPSCARGPLDL